MKIMLLFNNEQINIFKQHFNKLLKTIVTFKNFKVNDLKQIYLFLKFLEKFSAQYYKNFLSIDFYFYCLNFSKKNATKQSVHIKNVRNLFIYIKQFCCFQVRKNI